jgi:hypothetical protein
VPMVRPPTRLLFDDAASRFRPQRRSPPSLSGRHNRYLTPPISVNALILHVFRYFPSLQIA